MQSVKGLLGLAALALLGLASGPLAAQRIDPSRIIDLHINAERQDRSFGGSVPEGGKFRLTFQGHGTYAISPVLQDASGRTFLVTVLRGKGAPGPEQEFHAIETVQARLGVPAALKSLPQVAVVIERVRTVEVGSAFSGNVTLVSAIRSPIRPLSSAFSDYCCVSCGGIIACACAVSSDCGSCCVNPCCQKMPAPPPEVAFLGSQRSVALVEGGCRAVPDHERLFTAPAAVPAVVASRR